MIVNGAKLMKTFITLHLVLTFNCVAFFITSAHADIHVDIKDNTSMCQQTFHDYLDIYSGKQLQQHALQLYFSDNCMPYSDLELPQSAPQTIPSTDKAHHFKLLQRQDADDQISTYKT